MQENLVIVESPAKAKTIEKFLGKDYLVKSSFGHIRDLKKKDFGIDLENNYAPQYTIPTDKKKVVTELKSLAKKAKMVWLASDEDREGEAISWHLYEVLGLSPERTKRIVFHEITKEAILKAIESPRDIDINLVNAQQARRVLDRIVGFEISPILWRKVKPSLSAGRVQSVAVRLIVEREKDIIDYKAQSSFKVVAIFKVPSAKGKMVDMKAELNKRFKTQAEAEEFLNKCKASDFTIQNVEKKPTKKNPAAPFTTSTLQQEAGRKLGYSVAQTMSIAQRLYESGKITYMRTDSVNLAESALSAAVEEITSMAGENYVKTRRFNTKAKGAQEAHEAIRPTYLNQHEVDGSNQEQRLYELIWKRTIASQMSEAILEKTVATINVSGAEEHFVATGEVIKFDGFLRVYMESSDEEPEGDDENQKLLPPLQVGDTPELDNISATERFSQRPARFTEASLVRKLEELGIGRPSTYAPTISTIQNRGYVVKEDRPGTERDYIKLELKDGEVSTNKLTETYGNEKAKLFPTDIGMVVNDFLAEYFKEIMDYSFTANVEKEFDRIAEGNLEWTNAIDDFYKGFQPVVESTKENSERKVGERILGEDPKTGRQISVRIGRFGPMVQIGTVEEEEKPLFAGLKKEQSLATITLEEALELFKLPRNLGEFEESDVIIGAGRFGPYVRHKSKFVSIPKDIDPLEITLEESIELILAKRKKDLESIIKTFDEEPDLQVLKGRFGPYISYKKKNYKIVKGTDPESLSLEDCMKIIEAGPAPKGKRKTTKAKTTTKAKAKKTTTKTKK